MFNFNVGSEGHEGEYDLFKTTTQEVINLYGVFCKYIITEKVNKDFVFGEHSHIKINNEDTFKFFMLPQETDNWDMGSDIFSKMGLQNSNSITMFIGVQNMEEIHPDIVNKEGKGWDFIIGNLVVLPDNKIMEIIDFKHEVEGNNNLFTYDQRKNVYQITLKSYIANRDDYSDSEDITESDSFDYQDFGNLESIFNQESDDREEVEYRSQQIQDEIIYPAPPRAKALRNKPKGENTFGDFG